MRFLYSGYIQTHHWDWSLHKLFHRFVCRYYRASNVRSLSNQPLHTTDRCCIDNRVFQMPRWHLWRQTGALSRPMQEPAIVCTGYLPVGHFATERRVSRVLVRETTDRHQRLFRLQPGHGGRASPRCTWVRLQHYIWGIYKSNVETHATPKTRSSLSKSEFWQRLYHTLQHAGTRGIMEFPTAPAITFTVLGLVDRN